MDNIIRRYFSLRRAIPRMSPALCWAIASGKGYAA